MTSSSFASHTVFGDTWDCADILAHGSFIPVTQNVGSIDACIENFITYLGVRIFPQCSVTGFSLLFNGVSQTGEVVLARYDFTLACSGSPKHRTLEAARVGTRPSHQSIVKLSPLTASQEAPDVIASVEPDKTTKTLVAKVFNAETGQLVPNVGVKLKLDVVEQSGGHDHPNDNSRPKGELLSNTGQTNAERTILTGSTGANGLQFSFKAPAPAGDHTVTASCTDRTCTQEGLKTLFVGLKGLISLSISENYVLLQNRDKKHPDNHFMTPTAASKIAKLAEAYHKKFPKDPMLRLNDASLERGGIFDFDFPGRSIFWRPPHDKHRRGLNIDVRANPKVNADAIPQNNFPEFEKLAPQEECKAKLHNEGKSTQHYHVTCL